MTFQIHVAESLYSFPVSSALIVRAFVSLSLTTLYLWYNRLFHVTRLPRPLLLRLVLRGLLGALSGLCIFSALARLPAGVAVTIFYASPAITAVLAAIFLGDRFTPVHGVVLVVNFLGIALVSQQPSPSSSAATALASSAGGERAIAGILFALAGAFCAAAVFVLVKRMGLQVHFVMNAGSYGFGCLLLAPCLALATSVEGRGGGGGGHGVGTLHALVSNGRGLLLAVGSALAGFGSQTMLARGLQNAPAGPAVVVRSLNVPVVFFLGLAFMGETVGLNGMLGVALVIGSICFTGLWQLRGKRGSR